MDSHSSKFSRAAIALLFLALSVAGLRYASMHASAADQSDFDQYQSALSFLRDLAIRSQGAIDADRQRDLQDLIVRFSFALNYWARFPDPAGPLASQARRDCAYFTTLAARLLDGSGQSERVWVNNGGAMSGQAIARHWPSGNGVLLLHLGRSDWAASSIPRFEQVQCDLGRTSEAVLNLPAAETTYAALFFTNAPEGANRVKIRLRSGETELATRDLVVTTPPTGTLHVSILDGATGKITPVAAALYAGDNALMVPDDALSFDKGGYAYAPGRIRDRNEVHYWPGNAQQARAFFVKGEFSLRLPQGIYRFIATKGPEYLPVIETVAVKARSLTSHSVTIRRWTDMAARGWYSGDGHVHYARADEDANQRLLLWAQAEDVHVSNILRMGDAKQTYFEQYGFGKEGQFATGNHVLVPGQEDPRTNIIGHTLQLNIRRPVHLPDRYYLYDLVFDEVHRQGGVTGYAHVVGRDGTWFMPRRDMAMNIPAGRVDFIEFSEAGITGPEFYYEYLNLGFRLAASAGSDVPWGNTIGHNRVYVYTGDRFSVDAWYAGLKAGHTFVTTGAMLEFTVNGHIPGNEMEAEPGDVLHIKASASGKAVPPRYLEVVGQGDVVKSVKADAGQASLEFTLSVTGSTWLAARCEGAHTTPVYIKVGGQRFWKRNQVETLIARRMANLAELDDLLGQDIAGGKEGSYDSVAVWKQSAEDLRERVKSARAGYARLLEEFRR
jgi:hypothetical protein